MNGWVRLFWFLFGFAVATWLIAVWDAIRIGYIQF